MSRQVASLAQIVQDCNVPGKTPSLPWSFGSGVVSPSAGKSGNYKHQRAIRAECTVAN